VLVALIVGLHERRSPETLDFLIVEDGIVVGEQFYPFKEIKSFWLAYNPPEVKLLYFELDKSLRKELPIMLENQNPLEIRRILLNYLEENIENEEEAVDERLSRLFGL
jgi:hypothetical protein